jgi:hypothetical protein
MKKSKIFIACILCYGFIHLQSFSQTNTFPPSGAAGVGTPSPDASSIFELKSVTQGMLMPRMTKAQRDAISIPADGLIIYQTNNTPGLYYYNAGWKAVTSAAGASKSLSNLANVAINTDLIPATNGTLNLGSITKAWKNLYLSGSVFVNSKQTVASVSDINDNTLLGTGAGLNIISGKENIAIGNQTLNQNQIGLGNIAIGWTSLFFNTASFNTAVGNQSMFNNTDGNSNCSFGYQSLFSNTTTYRNNAFGYQSLYSNTGGIGIFDGKNNNAFGYKSLYSNTSGGVNSAFGDEALSKNTSGVSNTAIGGLSLYSNSTADQNTAIGVSSMYSNTTGTLNVASGFTSLYSNTTGSWNTALGVRALYTNTAQDKNTAVGWSAGDGTQSAASTYLGFNAHASVVVSGSMALGVNATVTASNQVRVGTNAITSIGGYVNWSNISDGRVKKNIKSNVPGLAFINKLNPVTYNLDLEAADRILQVQTLKDKEGKAVQFSAEESIARKAKEQIIYTGFVAQDVEKAAKQTGYDFSGVDAAKNDKDLYGLRYSDFVVPLVKAVQELSEQNNEKDKQINDLTKEIAGIKEQLNLLLQQTKATSTSSDGLKKYNDASATLEQNIPNPFTNNTIIKYIIPLSAKNAAINVYNSNGQLLKTVNLIAKGSGQINLNASEFSAGTYYYNLVMDGLKSASNKMILVK